MTSDRAAYLLEFGMGAMPGDYCEAGKMGAAALREVAALRAELDEAKAMLVYLPHEEAIKDYNEDNSINWKCDPDCPACARDARWPKESKQ